MALTEQYGPAQAAAWTGDTVETIVRTYVKPTAQAEAQAAKFLQEQNSGTQPRPQQGAAQIGGPKRLSLNDFPKCARQESNLWPSAPEADALSS